MQKELQENQIEEMAKEIFNTCAWRFSNPNDYKEVFNDIAEDLTKLNYQKLSKDSVVLSKEDYQLWNVLKKTWASDDKEVSAEDMLEMLKSTKELGSKETAGKIYLQLQEHGTTYVKKWIQKAHGIDLTPEI